MDGSTVKGAYVATPVPLGVGVTTVLFSDFDEFVVVPLVESITITGLPAPIHEDLDLYLWTPINGEWELIDFAVGPFAPTVTQVTFTPRIEMIPGSWELELDFEHWETGDIVFQHNGTVTLNAGVNTVPLSSMPRVSSPSGIRSMSSVSGKAPSLKQTLPEGWKQLEARYKGLYTPTQRSSFNLQMQLMLPQVQRMHSMQQIQLMQPQIQRMRLMQPVWPLR